MTVGTGFPGCRKKFSKHGKYLADDKKYAFRIHWENGDLRIFSLERLLRGIYNIGFPVAKERVEGEDGGTTD